METKKSQGGLITVALAVAAAAIMVVSSQAMGPAFWLVTGSVGFMVGIMRYERRIGGAGFLGLLVAMEAGRFVGGAIALSSWTPWLRYSVLSLDMLIGAMIFFAMVIAGNHWAIRHPIVR